MVRADDLASSAEPPPTCLARFSSKESAGQLGPSGKPGVSKQLRCGALCCYAEVWRKAAEEVRAMLVGETELRGQKYNFTLHRTPGRLRVCLRAASCRPGADEMSRYTALEA